MQLHTTVFDSELDDWKSYPIDHFYLDKDGVKIGLDCVGSQYWITMGDSVTKHLTLAAALRHFANILDKIL